MTLHTSSLYWFGSWKLYFSKVNMSVAWLKSVNLSKESKKGTRFLIKCFKRRSSNNLFLVLGCPWGCPLCPYCKTPCGVLELALPCSRWSYPCLPSSALGDITTGSLKPTISKMYLHHGNLANATNPGLFYPRRHLPAYHWHPLFNKYMVPCTQTHWQE